MIISDTIKLILFDTKKETNQVSHSLFISDVTLAGSSTTGMNINILNKLQMFPNVKDQLTFFVSGAGARGSAFLTPENDNDKNRSKCHLPMIDSFKEK